MCQYCTLMRRPEVPNQRHKSGISSLQVEFGSLLPCNHSVCHDMHLFRLRIKKTRGVRGLQTEFENYLNEK